MNIVFVSNYFNHHQKPFCDELYERTDGSFTFISTAVMRSERKALGYGMDEYPEYVLLSYENEKKRNEALALISGADVVIAGSAPEELLTERIRSGKLLFRYWERPFKLKTSLLKKAYHYFNLRKRNLFKNNIYMLCAGAYTASDFESIGMYKNRTYKWGYFPEAKKHNADTLFSQKKSNTILWCGRMIDWKHPDDAVRAAAMLKADGCDFELIFVGNGAMEQSLRELVTQYGLSDNVSFLGAVPSSEVRSYMEKAGIVLLTSDRQEGWGAVLNEAMGSGCAVVASDAAGSVPYLVRNGENGIVYPSSNVQQLYEGIKYLLASPAEQTRLGRAAVASVTDEWNAVTAAERFLILSEKLLQGEDYPELFESGPCSKA